MKWKLLVFIAASCYGILSTLVKLAYEDGFDLADVVYAQIGTGAILLWILVLIRRLKGKPTGIQAANWWKVALSGIPISMTSLLYYESVKYLPASIAILGLFQFVWIGVVLDAIATRKMPSLIKIVSVLILMGGTVLAIGIWDNPSVLATLPAKGIIYGFLSGLSYALFIFFNDHYGSDMPAISASALKVTGGAVLLLFILSPLPVVDNILTTDLMWQFGLPTAFLGMVIPTVFFAMAVPKVGVTLSSIISSVELPMAVFFSSLILEETVTFSQWLGVVVILLAIALPQWVKK